MVKLLLKIAYHGGRYAGFQSQRNGTTVQETLTEAVSALFGRLCTVTGCSRTDSGVHALGFCACVAPVTPDEHWCTIPLNRVYKACNLYLPDDIAVMDAAFVPEDFHPRYDAVSKEYLYKIADDDHRNPFTEGLVYRIPKRISDDALDRMRETAAFFRGTHDFRAFMAQGSKVSTTVRTITDADIKRENGILIFRVAADGFLYNMVRILTGTLLDTASGKTAPSEIPAILASGDRRRAGITVPAHGLYLHRVLYGRPVVWGSEIT